jgi:hypothetical protein
VIALRRRWIIGGRYKTRGQDGQQKCENSGYWIHVNVFVAVQLGFA